MSGGSRVVRIVLAVFVCSTAALADGHAWRAESPKFLSNMGYSVAPAGDVNGDGFDDVIVGLPYWTIDTPSSSNIGHVHVHYGSRSGPSTEPSWTLEGAMPNFNLGASVAPAGDVNGDGYDDVIIGTERFNSSGPIRVFYGSATGLPAAPSWIPTAGIGDIVASAGDVNDDGYDDVIVGFPFYDNGQTNEGRALVYLGSATGLAPTPAWTYEPDQTEARLGAAVASAGDVNGDGFADVVVGAPRFNSAATDDGLVLVFLGSPSGPSLTPSWSVAGDVAFRGLGWSVAGAGDVNHDGFDDVIVGVSCCNAYAYYGSASGLPTSPSWTVTPPVANVQFGWDVAPAGDFNADGFDDVLVAAPDLNLAGVGRVELHYGSATGLAPMPGWTATEEQAGSWFGYSAAGAGDTDGDGRVEIIVGAPRFNPFGPGTGEFGAAYLYATVTHPASAVPDGDAVPGAMLTVGKPFSSLLTLDWGAACSSDDADYEVYEGTLGSFSSHTPIKCGTAFARSITFFTPPGNVYYLVVPHRLGREGSYGRTHAGVERPQGVAACLPQEIAACE